MTTPPRKLALHADALSDSGVDLNLVVGAGSGATVVGSVTTHGASPLSVSAPGGLAAGDLIILAVCTVNSVLDASGPTGATFTELLRIDASSNEWQGVYYAFATGSETTLEVTHSSGSEAALAVVVYRGVDTLHSFAYASDSLEAPAAIGHPQGLDIRVWTQVNAGIIGAPLGDAWTLDAYVNHGAVYNDQVVIVHRDCRSSFDVPAVGAPGLPSTYSLGATMVWYVAP